MRINRWTALWLAVVGVLAALLLLELGGVIHVSVFVASIFLFLLALIVTAVLAGAGGMFLGAIFTHYRLMGQDFTPFEREMLAMRAEVKAIREELQALSRALPRLANGAGKDEER